MTTLVTLVNAKRENFSRSVGQGRFINFLISFGRFVGACLGREKLKAASSIRLAACRLVMMAKLGDRRDKFAEFALAVNGISAWPRGTGEYARVM